MEIGESELDEDNIPEIEEMVSVCAGLVTVDEESDIIRLVHHTTQEYFERNQEKWFSEAQNDVTMTCVTYLSFDALAGFCPTDEEFETRLRLNPLYDYAARNWGHHARVVAAIDVEQSVLDVLESEAWIAGPSQVTKAFKLWSYDSGYSQRVPRQISGAHVAAYFGLREALLKTRYDLDLKNSDGRTPLSWAAENGHEAAVRLLVEKGADLESKDRSGQAPLLWAAKNGHEAVVRLLVEKGAELESKDKSGRTPLSWAVRYGHEAVVRLLVEKAAEKDESGQMPLS